jgi:GNAT superfamily N-acetyltransferase
MVVIRLWTQVDIDSVAQSVQREGWGHTRRDVERCWRFEPNGCFIAEVEGRPVGHVFTVSYGKVGWIALLIVNPESRGKGVGTVLIEKAIDFLRKVGVETIRLDAVPKAVSLYKRLGFTAEFDSLRFSRLLGLGRKSGRGEGVLVFPIREEDVEEVAEFDSGYFGANRLCVLRGLYDDESKRCFVAKQKRRILGYVMCRETLKGHWIGPFVCRNHSIAKSLLRVCMDTFEGRETELRLGMPAANKDGVALMERLSFHLTSKSVHMVLGKRTREGDISGVFGIGGAEKG